jgi:hypothetical protein
VLGERREVGVDALLGVGWADSRLLHPSVVNIRRWSSLGVSRAWDTRNM